MNLIYQISVGSKGDELLTCCIASLRKSGNYKDDIIIFTDHPLSIDGATVLPIIDPINWTFETISMLRVNVALEKIDFSKYENIMYLDTDHLAFNDINCFFNTNDKLWGMGEGKAPNGYSIYHGGYLTEEEKSFKNANCYCSGILCGPNKLFKHTLKLWQNAFNEQYMGLEKYREQSAFNIIIYRHLIEISLYPDNWICGARHNTYSAFTYMKMVHFWHRSKNSMPRIWSKYVKDSYNNRSG